MKILWWVILIVLGHFTLIYIFEKIFLNILKIFKNSNLVLNLKYLILSNDQLDKKKKENFLILDRNLKNSFNNEIFYYGNNFLYNLEQKKKINKIKKTYKNNLNYKNLKLKYKLIDFNKKNKSRQSLNNQERQFDIFEMFRNDISSNKKNYFINKKKSINNDNYIINNQKQLINLNLFLKQKNKNFKNSLFLSNKTYNFNTLNFNWNKLNLFSINSKLKLSNSNNDEIMENLKIFLLYNFSYKYYSNLNLNYNYNTSKNYQKNNFEQMYAPKMHFNKIKNTKNKKRSLLNKKKTFRWTTLSLFDDKYETKFINKLNIGQRINLWSLLPKKSTKKKSLYNKKKKEIILWIKNKYTLFNKIKKGSNKKFRWTTNLFNTLNDNKKKIKWTKFNFLKIAKNKFIFSNIISKKKKFRWITNLFNTVKNGNKKIKWTKFNFINITKMKKKKVNWTTNLVNIVKSKSKKKKVRWTKFNFINITKIKKKKVKWTTNLLNIVKGKSKKKKSKLNKI